ncbi:DNA-directed RNA polymerase I and III subunit RPAC1 [Cryptococcus neoformans]|uniref:DNA-directed RNA polymerases I and III subunit RPAC1 n=2 Tax=Cryptococcus neoformans TaxID=5207 RepID=A0A854QJQ6_CRYNE|nr:DNA-directed RNA polymerase I and III subunit RPAC1 [Cryptococcus neoformans var. grubii H99]AUB24703.1 DNA-directed RNA polymerase I and III subunit RPAC1 [Cryptococcus neoformans var. grubii]OWT39952.1 DNA-directed RNA polymerase I and III subunit RPAC1 [Cryptococcus neoformans var. grubii Bt1]OWZ32419.1 DNA-directed RNA polymerase I and III subunit RPAC1 [Cryptococcus neoformans var. grubii AD2-60a]OWZ44266.1 DNA-directed RNA polymerase I and III subunit RPAC1 [Cryptococcus neoformans var|eukprot:XP_012049368.1 DNA-directed RNA polymerase I and III subunit RPAC1 [Cryptococcus neoformans var. grubii H99]
MPSPLDNTRRHVQVFAERVGAVAGSEFPGHYPGEDHSWNLQKFKQDLVASVQRLTPSTIEFDLVGVDASIANALRRTLIAEVPTVAIEEVYVWNNTSIMQDEVLCHRVGLVPLKIDPRSLRYRPSANSQPHEHDTVVFDLRVRCDRRPNVDRSETDPKKMYFDSNVYSGMLKWVPSGDQKKKFKGKAPRPVNDDILLVKLRPGQQVDLHCFARKGVGADHAKFSPVATASYRLLPHIILRGPIPKEHQQKFKGCFPPGVIEIEKDESGEDQCVVKNPRKDTVSREVLRHPEFQDLVQLARIRDHFIFNVESAGQYSPEELVPEAIKILLGKIKDVEEGLDKLFATDGQAA